jgi:SAM-dependent methyltransferase
MIFSLFRRLKRIAVIVLRYYSPLCSYGIALFHLRKNYHRRWQRIRSHYMLLDIGCGNGFTMSIIRGFYKGVAIGLDVNVQMCKRCKSKSTHDDVILASASKLPFISETFDIAVAFEVIEHLPKEAGYKMLDELDQVAKHIILTTHKGFVPRVDGKFGWSHLSGWLPSEFKAFGWRVYGAPGDPRKGPLSILSIIIQRLVLPLSYFAPRTRLAKHMVVVK